MESDGLKTGHDRYDPMIEMAFFKQVILPHDDDDDDDDDDDSDDSDGDD